MKAHHFSHHSSDKKQIYVHRWIPEGKPKAILFIAHGMGDHGARYEALAKKLTDAGWTVYAPDHRGHGKTATSPAEYGWFAEKDGFRRVIEDLHEAINDAKIGNSGLPVFLCGHSMGALLSLGYIALYGRDLAGCALSGIPALAAPGLLAVGKALASLGSFFRGSKASAPLLDMMSFGAFNKPFAPNRTKFDWLSRDEAEVDKYINDPACGFTCSYGFFRDLLAGLEWVYAPATQALIPKDLPIRLLAGEMDSCSTPSRKYAQFHGRLKDLGVRDLSMKLYPGARHEIMNETNREEVHSDLLAWLEEKLAGR